MRLPRVPETTNQTTSLLVLAAVLLFAATTSHSQTYTDLYNLGTDPNDPTFPTWTGFFAQGRDGNLYSTAPCGGSGNNCGNGGVFQLTPAGKMTVLHHFNIDDGVNSQSGLTLGRDGSLYGTAPGGGVGTYASGTVFKITTSGKFKVLHTFDWRTEGSGPVAPPIQGSDGNFYGLTAYGKGGGSGTGMFYKMTPKGKLTSLYQFDNTHGGHPIALMQGNDGNFYGTTMQGGTGGGGVVFKVTSRGTYTVLSNFDGTHGYTPVGPIIQASDGNFYGTTRYGGTDGYGVIYKVTPGGALSTIFIFLAIEHGYAKPLAGLVQATDGKFYGATDGGGANSKGMLFQVTFKGKFTDLYDFKGSAGLRPQVSLFQHTNGTFYSDTYEGGTQSKGVLYSLDMGLGKFVRFVGPDFRGKVGNSIEILGQGFTGTTNVSFHGVPAAFSVVSDTYLTATVPDGATTGTVAVTTPAGTLNSNRVFLVTPAILSFSPTSGPVGTPVTITGTSFTGAKKVTFGGVKATTFSVDSDTQITATVPTGAVTGKIQVTTPSGTATSPEVFTVTQ